MFIARKMKILLLLLALCGTVGCDQATKHIARTKLSRWEGIALPGGFGELRLAENHGAFLSLGASLSPALRTGIFILAVSVGLTALVIYVMRNARLDWFTFTGCALAAAGGFSNLIDRVTREGAVTDFILLRWGPLQTGIFNIADMAIMLGIALVAIAIWKQPAPPAPVPPN